MGGPSRKECDRQRDKVCVDRSLKVRLAAMVEELRKSGKEATQQGLVNEAIGLLFQHYHQTAPTPRSMAPSPRSAVAETSEGKGRVSRGGSLMQGVVPNDPKRPSAQVVQVWVNGQMLSMQAEKDSTIQSLKHSIQAQGRTYGAMGASEQVTGISLSLDDSLSFNSLEAAQEILSFGRSSSTGPVSFVAQTCSAPVAATPVRPGAVYGLPTPLKRALAGGRQPPRVSIPGSAGPSLAADSPRKSSEEDMQLTPIEQTPALAIKPADIFGIVQTPLGVQHPAAVDGSLVFSAGPAKTSFTPKPSGKITKRQLGKQQPVSAPAPPYCLISRARLCEGLVAESDEEAEGAGEQCSTQPSIDLDDKISTDSDSAMAPEDNADVRTASVDVEPGSTHSSQSDQFVDLFKLVEVATEICRCGRGPAAFTLDGPDSEQRKLIWCPDCPDLPQEAVPIKRQQQCICGLARAVYGLPGEDRVCARWCKKCKPQVAVDVTRVRCNCGLKMPSLGYPGEKPQWCTQCPDKPPEAVNVKSRKCECGHRIPYFGLPGGRAVWCSLCPGRPADAVAVKSRRCECGRVIPSFGMPGWTRGRARWCASCPTKPPGAENIVARKCECGRTQPSLGLLGGISGCRDAVWCAKCPSKPAEAVNVLKRASGASLFTHTGQKRKRGPKAAREHAPRTVLAEIQPSSLAPALDGRPTLISR